MDDYFCLWLLLLGFFFFENISGMDVLVSAGISSLIWTLSPTNPIEARSVRGSSLMARIVLILLKFFL